MHRFWEAGPPPQKKKIRPSDWFSAAHQRPNQEAEIEKKNKKAKLIGRVRLSNGLSAEIRENGISLGDPPMIYGIT